MHRGIIGLRKILASCQRMSWWEWWEVRPLIKTLKNCACQEEYPHLQLEAVRILGFVASHYDVTQKLPE